MIFWKWKAEKTKKEILSEKIQETKDLIKKYKGNPAYASWVKDLIKLEKELNQELIREVDKSLLIQENKNKLSIEKFAEDARKLLSPESLLTAEKTEEETEDKNEERQTGSLGQ